jgi:hypothetical protein
MCVVAGMNMHVLLSCEFHDSFCVCEIPVLFSSQVVFQKHKVLMLIDLMQAPTC